LRQAFSLITRPNSQHKTKGAQAAKDSHEAEEQGNESAGDHGLTLDLADNALAKRGAFEGHGHTDDEQACSGNLHGQAGQIHRIDSGIETASSLRMAGSRKHGNSCQSSQLRCFAAQSLDGFVHGEIP
jgi:hypothetical protein